MRRNLNSKFILALLLSFTGIGLGMWSDTYTIIPNEIISELGMYLAILSAIVACVCIAALAVPQAQIYIVSKQARIQAHLTNNGIENSIGKWNYNKFFIILFTSEILIFFTYAGGSNAIRNLLKEKEYKEYGMVLPVVVSSTSYKKGTWAEFSFEYNNHVYHNELKADVQKGDTVYIIYSTSNPDIVDWAYEYR